MSILFCAHVSYAVARLQRTTKQLRHCIGRKQDIPGPRLKCWDTYSVFTHSRISFIWVAVTLPVTGGLEPDLQAHATLRG
jgi:hypothetical protein